MSKEDPNAVRKKLLSPEQKEKIRKRVAEDLGIKIVQELIISLGYDSGWEALRMLHSV